MLQFVYTNSFASYECVVGSQRSSHCIVFLQDEKAEGFVSLPEFKIDQANECRKKLYVFFFLFYLWTNNYNYDNCGISRTVLIFVPLLH